MDFQDMRIELHKDKNIGKVLFIVEGSRTEPYIMTKLFTSILDYQLETKLREKGYKQYNSKVNPDSKIFVINAQQSNIRFIEKDDGYLNNLFKELIEEYDFDIDNAAILSMIVMIVPIQIILFWRIFYQSLEIQEIIQIMEDRDCCY